MMTYAWLRIEGKAMLHV